MVAVAVERVRRIDPRPSSALPTPPSSSSRQISCLELVLDVVVELEPVGVEHLEAVVLGRVVGGGDHDPGARYGPVRARNARAGVGTTPTTWTSTPRLVAPATIAATNMSPDRRVSWPTTIGRPARPAVRAVARPRAKARVGLEVDVGDAADPVRAEEACHRLAARRRRGARRRRRDGRHRHRGGLGRHERRRRPAGSRRDRDIGRPGRECRDVEIGGEGRPLEPVQVGGTRRP